MMQKLSFLSLALITLMVCNTSFAQESSRWNNPGTYIMSSGNYVPLPSETYVQPVTAPRKISTPQGDLVVAPNIRVLPGSVSQTEVPITISRANPLLMFGSSNAVNGSTINSGSYMTTDGGNSWFGTNTINNGNTANQRGDPGPAYGKDSRLIFTHLSSTSNFGGVTGMQAEYSTNFGVNFSSSIQVHTSGTDDKNLACGDDVPTSPYYGNFYMAFCDYSSGASFCARTTNGGVSWVAPVSWPPPAGLQAQGHDVVTRPNGDVIVSYAIHGPNSPWTETGVGIGRSTDGGATFTALAPAYATNGTRSLAFNGWNIRTNGFTRIACDKSGGARNGWLYVVMSEYNLAPAGSDADIVLHRSTDGGLTWSAGFRVNQDPINNGKVQWFPCVCVDENGGLNVAYYDNRSFASVGDSASIFISRSLDGGNTWVDVEVADHHFKPKPDPLLSGGYMGDYMGCCAGNGKVWAFWMDDKSGTYNAWAGYITSGPPLAHNIACGPFMSTPTYYLINTPYNIKTKVTNIGTSNETAIPVKFYVDGALINTTNINLNASQNDSVSNSWQTATAGNHNLMYISALGTDLDRTNDTVRMTINVLTTPPPTMCPFFCQPPTTYTPITGGSPGPTGDDAGVTAPIGFSFQYVTDSYTQVWICTNGFIEMGPSGSTNYINGLCGASDVNMVAGFWDDLNAANNITYLTTGTAPNRVFTVQYANVAFLSGSGNVTFQIKLYENGGTGQVVDIVYGTGVNNASATGSVGINVAPGGSTHITSITPGATCASTTFSTTVCNDAVTYNIPSGTFYRFCDLVGVEPTSNAIPKVFSLEQNYPNPFNPTTVIKFGIPKSGLVKLVVYDLLGRTVETLVNENKEAGNYQVDFNATNLASGVYFYRIEAGDFIAVKKMLLIK